MLKVRNSADTGWDTVGGAGGGLTVAEVDGTPSIAGTTTLQVPNGQLSNPSGTVARLDAAPTVHTHAAADTTSGVFAIARLATGTPNGAQFVRDDGTLAVPSGTNPMTAQDDLIVGGASGAPARLAKGADGQVLTVDPTTHHLLWATPAAGGTTLDPPGTLRAWDDFDTGGTTSGAIGARNWALVGAGTPTLALAAAEAGHPGLVRLAVGASAGAHGSLQAYPTGVGSVLPADAFDLTWVVRPTQVDANTTIRVGLGVNPFTNPADHGLWVDCAGGNWFRVARQAATQTRTDTGIAATTGWWKVRVRRVDASTIGYTLNANAEQTLTTNLPTAALMPFVQITTAVNTAKSVDVDLVSLIVTGLGR